MQIIGNVNWKLHLIKGTFIFKNGGWAGGIQGRGH